VYAGLERFTLLEVRIGTGRTHQIRVQLSASATPWPATRYTARRPVEGRPPLGRVFLHATGIRFTSQLGRGDRVRIAAAC